VIVENFHIILHDQPVDQTEGSNRLLEALSDESLFGVLATSVAQAAHDDEKAKLPDDYRRISLKPLNTDECRALWTSLTGQKTKLERIRPLQILTGGSPRLLHILAEFMKTPSLQDLMGNLNLLIDQNTEYFKSQLDALPPVERKVFAALLDAWDPSTAKQVAESARVNTNIASAMLAQLTDRGAVIKEPGHGRTAIYYAAERLFNIYYLMRRRSHPSSRVRALVSFMTEYYDRDELVHTTAILVKEACTVAPDRRGDYHSTFHAIMSRAPEAVQKLILEQTPQDFIRTFRVDQKAQRDEHISHQQYIGDDDIEINRLIEGVEAAADAEEFGKAFRLLEEATALRPSMGELWIRRSILHLRQSDYIAAAKAADRARELKPEDPWAHALLGIAMAKAGDEIESQAAFLQALKLDPGQIVAVRELAKIRESEGDDDAAVDLYERARKNDQLPDLLRSRYGLLLHRLGRDEDAEILLREGLSEPENFETRRALVDILDESARADEGVSVLRSAAEQHDSWEAWADLGWFLWRSNKNAEAKRAARTAIEKGGADPGLYRLLALTMVQLSDSIDEIGIVADELTKRLPHNAMAWTTAGTIYTDLGQEDRAEQSYRIAKDLAYDSPATVLLARLLQSNPNRRGEAEALLREAVSAAEQASGPCVPFKALAEYLIHNGEDLAASEVLQRALRLHDGCSCCLVLNGEICTRRGENATAESYFRAALKIAEDDISALTGLSRLVGTEEAEAMITRAIAADPGDPRCLLAHARLPSTDHEAQLKDGYDALELDPKFIEAHLLLAPLNAARGKSAAAIENLRSALSGLATKRELIPSFVHSAMAVATLGEIEPLIQLVTEHEFGSAVEPLAVALRLLRGETPLVAKEVLEVAKDILQRSHAIDKALS
jgi:tetratricopeptide (TPR) repeat protein